MTTDQTIEKIKEVTRSRLPNVERWQDVQVRRKKYSIVIHWNGVKRNNSGWHSLDVRVPIWEIDNYLSRQRRKLKEKK